MSLVVCLGLLSTGLQAGEQKGSSPGDVSQAGVTFSPKAQAQAYIDMAVEAHDRQGDLDGAEQWLERALEIDPYHPVARKMLEQVKAEKQQAGLQRMGVALGTLQQMMERMEQHKEDQPQEEGEPGQTEEPSADDEEPPTSADESAPKGPVFGKGRSPVHTIEDSPEPKASSSPAVQPSEEAGSPTGPSYEGLARALQLALPRQQIQEPGPSPRQMHDEGKKEAAYDPSPTFKSPTVDASRLAEKRCSPEELEELVGMLNETGRMLLWLMASQESGKGQKASSTAPPPPATDQGFIGLLGQLCEKLKGMKPRGLKGMLPKGGKVPGGCAWALFVQGLGGPGGEMGQGALACIQKYSQQGPPPLQADAVRFPVGNCGKGRPRRSWVKRANSIMKKSTKAFKEAKKSEGVKKEFFGKLSRTLDIMAFDALEGKTEKRYEMEKSNGGFFVTFWFEDTVYYVGDEGVLKIEPGKVKVEKPTQEHTRVRLKTKEQPKDKSTPAEGGGEGRPVGPGEGDCNESPAQKRARAIFNCIFGGPPQVAPGGTPEPVTYPTGPSGPTPPKDCNEVNMAAIWGSSTAAGGGATNPEGPEDLMRRGPAIPKGFIPKIHGAIDPPKESVALPGGKDIPRGGPPGSEDQPKGKDDD